MARLTPDITIRGRMPTQAEYRLHMKLLEDIEHDEKHFGRGESRVFRNWLGKDMTDLEHEVWVAVDQQGLVRQNREGFHRLTPYGKLYLSQRKGFQRDPSARSAYTLNPTTVNAILWIGSTGGVKGQGTSPSYVGNERLVHLGLARRLHGHYQLTERGIIAYEFYRAERKTKKTRGRDPVKKYSENVGSGQNLLIRLWLEAFGEARASRPGSKPYRHKMDRAQAIWWRMTESSRRYAIRFLQGEETELPPVARDSRKKSRTQEVLEIRRFLESKGHSGRHALKLYTHGLTVSQLRSMEPYEISRLIYPINR